MKVYALIGGTDRGEAIIELFANKELADIKLNELKENTEIFFDYYTVEEYKVTE